MAEGSPAKAAPPAARFAAMAEGGFTGQREAQCILTFPAAPSGAAAPPCLFLGPATRDAADFAAKLRALPNLTAVVSIMDEPYTTPREIGLEHLEVRVKDDQSELLPHLTATFAFIDRAAAAGGSVFVHCASGISRSSTAVVAYCLARCGMSLADAFAGVHARRPCILPSDGLFQELVRLEKRVTGEGKASMTAGDYNVYQLASMTTQPVAKCRHALEKAGGDVNRAMNSLFG